MRNGDGVSTIQQFGSPGGKKQRCQFALHREKSRSSGRVAKVKAAHVLVWDAEEVTHKPQRLDPPFIVAPVSKPSLNINGGVSARPKHFPIS